MNRLIVTADQLEAHIGKPIPLADLKVIDHLDEGALSWITKSPLMFAGFSDADGIGITVGGGPPGFASGDFRELRLPTAMLDNPALAKPGAGFGSIFFLPGITEILRINGRVAGVAGDAIRITVDECYIHCGKALIRSEFWAPTRTVATSPDQAAAFISASRFMALASANANGRADVSPKGDLAGTMAHLDGGLLWCTDRPGNRRLDTFRNIMTQPRVAALLMLPGSTQVACLSGIARITTDEAVRARFTVRDKQPAVAIGIEYSSIDLLASAALARASLWPITPTEGISPSKISVAHLRLNKSVKARLAGAMLSLPGLVVRDEVLQKIMEKEYKKGLF